MQKMHQRMGDTNFPDKVVDYYVIKACFKIAELVWNSTAQDQHERTRIAKTMCIIIAGYYGGSRGKGIVKVDQGLRAKQFDHAVARRDDPFVPLAMLGRFKQRTRRKTFIQPLAGITDENRNLSK